jgi:hypothetical protein
VFVSVTSLCLWRGRGGGFGTIYNLFQINWELGINESFHIYDEGRIVNVIFGTLCLFPIVLKVDPRGNKSKSKTISKQKIHKNTKNFGHKFAKGPQIKGKFVVLKKNR